MGSPFLQLVSILYDKGFELLGFDAKKIIFFFLFFLGQIFFAAIKFFARETQRKEREQSEKKLQEKNGIFL